jgi:4-hydroxy-tetrahydrodipicolinate synthase
MIKGSLVAIVTPMHRDGSLDLPRMESLIAMHHREGTAAVVVLGTTGESPTLEDDEYERLIAASVELAKGKLPLLAGIGANSTKHAVHLAKIAQRAGAVAGLSVVPYYNKPTQQGMYRHFAAVAEETGFPQIVYNIPGRTSCDMTNETILRLAENRAIIGIKDATSHMGRAAELAAHAPAHFALYAGDDDSALAFMLVGGHGTISVAANVAPRLVSELCQAAVAGDVARARALNTRLLPIYKMITLQTNPIPIKFAMAQLGLIEEGIRLPMTWLEEPHHAAVKAALRALE